MNHKWLLMPEVRSSIPTKNEIIDLAIADIALSIAFAVVLSGFTNVLYYLPITLFAVTVSFILHEYMHKIVAQHFGAIAAFKRSDIGIVIALLTSFFGFLMAMPGATMIYTDSFTKKENGVVSLAGPLTNLLIFSIVFLLLFFLPIKNTYLEIALSFAAFINLWLAYFNMLPIYPLDGSKVLSWNKPLYCVVLVVIVLLLLIISPLLGLSLISMLYNIVFLFIIAIFMSFFYMGIMFRNI